MNDVGCAYRGLHSCSTPRFGHRSFALSFWALRGRCDGIVFGTEPLPCGVRFDNFEVRQRYVPGQSFIFGNTLQKTNNFARATTPDALHSRSFGCREMKPTMRWICFLVLLTTAAGATVSVYAAEVLSSSQIRVTTSADSDRGREVLAVKVDDKWVDALDGVASVHVRTDSGMHACSLRQVKAIKGGLLLTGDCGVGGFEQRVMLTPESDVLDVSTRLRLDAGAAVSSVEDRYDFVPARHASVDEHTGPLEFVWSQNIKKEADDLIPAAGFKSPAVMLQQGAVFVALLPLVSDRHVATRALDVDVTSGARAWIANGAISSQPHGHSYFRRSVDKLSPIDHVIEYRYSIVLSPQPQKLGYRRVVRRLWQQIGRPELLRSGDEQQNALRPELSSFSSWRTEAWHTYADKVYASVDCGVTKCGTLMSLRNIQGDWAKTEPDAWFNAWFESLRTAYGWYVYGRATHDPEMMRKAESVLNLALSSPRNGGAFSTNYLVNNKQWLPGDGWASYKDSYHSFSMSWTAYWMLRWAEDLTPERKAEVLRFVKPYGDFLIQQQEPSGVIPSWYIASTLQPMTEFRDSNAETGASALLLTEPGTSSGDPRYVAAAERAMSFVLGEVVPRQRWFDFETYLSCARKDYSFYDQWTAQYPQNNLAEIQTVEAMIALYRVTGKREYLNRGAQVLDYLLLTQQVWDNPSFTPKLLGGFTTQNTDAEWSDARQGYAAIVLYDFCDATGDFDDVERAVAAARASFAVAPWENWAHTGYRDEPGAMTGFHWGTGSTMTSVELLSPELGDAMIDLNAKRGVGFDECTIDAVDVQDDAISFYLSSAARERNFQVRFRGAQVSRRYRVRWNGGPVHEISGRSLSKDGVTIGPLG